MHSLCSSGWNKLYSNALFQSRLPSLSLFFTLMANKGLATYLALVELRMFPPAILIMHEVGSDCGREMTELYENSR